MTKLTPYEKLLKMGKDAINATLAPVRAKSAMKKGELEIVQLEEKVATLECELNELCSKTDIDFKAIRNKMDEIALVERQQKQMVKIIAELFPEK